MNENAALYFVDRHVAEGRQSKIAFREAGVSQRSLSYGELKDLTATIAGAMLRADLRREERVILLVLDQIEFPVLFWGALKAGIIPVPLNTLLAPSVYADIIRDSRAGCLFVSSELYDAVQPVLKDCPSLRKIVVIGGEGPEGATSMEAFIRGAEPVEPLDVTADEPAFWLYSSGSTGKPKGVRHVHGSLRYTCDTYAARVLGIQETDTVYSVAKMFFAYGLGNAMSFPMSVGATTVLLRGRPTPQVVTDILVKETPTLFCGVPTLYAAMLHHWDTTTPPVETALRLCISAGEALPEEVGKSWRDRAGVDILDGVGSTEMLHIFLSNRRDDVVYGTSGTAVPGYQLRLVDEAGHDVPPGGIGELLVCGSSSADGYWNQRAKSRATFEGVWTRTGDKYELTEQGRYVYCGRTDDMFKVSGIWVSPFEIEQALVAHPAVLEAAVVARRDDEGLEKPKAYVVLKEVADSAALGSLKEFVKERIGKWKYPRWIEVIDQLPKTATGKIQRFKLRDRG